MELKLPNIASFYKETIDKVEAIDEFASTGGLGNLHDKVLKTLSKKNPIELLSMITALGNGDLSKANELNSLGEELFDSCPDIVKTEINNVLASLPSNPVEAIESLQSDADGGLSDKINRLMEVLHAV